MMLNQEDATTYQPSSAVKWLHERQRWDKDFHTVSNDFPNILDTEDRKPWLEGAIMYGAVIVGVGCGIVLVLLIGYIVAACCIKPPEAKQNNAGQQNTLLLESSNGTGQPRKVYNRKRLILMVVLCFVFLGISLMLFKPVRKLARTYQNANNALRDITRKFDNVNANSSQALKNVTYSNGVVSTAIKEDPSIDNLAKLQHYLNQANDASTSTISALKLANKKLNVVINRGRTSTQEEGQALGYTATGTMCLGVLLLLFNLIPKQLCSCGFRSCGVPLNLQGLMFFWVVAAMIIVVGMLMGDYCMDPPTNTVNLLEYAMGKNTNASNSVSFYVQCEKSKGISPKDGAAFLASQSQRFMENATLLYPQVNSSVANSNISSGTKKEFKKMEYRLKDAMKKFGGANTSLACSSLQPSWYHFRDAVCTDAPDKIILIFASVIVASILLSVILLLGWTACVGHPGRKMANLPPPMALDGPYDDEDVGRAPQTDSQYHGFNIQE